MKTTLTLLIITLFCSLQLAAQDTKEVCDCPKPTRDQFQKICGAIYDKADGSEGTKLGYLYHELLWEISCVNPSMETIEQAKSKIQKMWLENREAFRCYKFTGVTVGDGNVLKFAMDNNFSTFLISAVKKYELDMNFIDPADGETILDFLKKGKEYFNEQKNEDKVNEYKKIYDLLLKYGAKHANEL